MFNESSPASFNLDILCLSTIPLVVIAICFISLKFLMSWTISTKSFLTVGLHLLYHTSPPVRRILTTPAFTNKLTILFNSSLVNNLSFSVKFTPSSGIQ